MPNPIKSLTPGRALTIIIIFFLLLLLMMEYQVLQGTHGVFSYPVDDTYIHMAIAKNIAFHHVWGISPHGFSSAASSVLYPLLLAFIVKIFGAHIIIPFIVNVLAGLVFLSALHKWLMRQNISDIAALLIMTAVVILTPLNVMVMTGMEHTLQILFCFLFVTTYGEEMARIVQSGDKNTMLSWMVYLYGFLMTGIRYEGIVLVALAGFLLFLADRTLEAVKLLLISSLPILLFGFYSMYHGSYFMPNSVLLKTGAPRLNGDGLFNFFTNDIFYRLSLSRIAFNMAAVQRLMLILPLTYLLFRDFIRKDTQYRYMLILLTFSLVIHLFLTGKGRFPRYEAYLVANGVILTGTLFARYGRDRLKTVWYNSRWVAIFAGLFLAMPIIMRSKDALTLVNQASVNIFQQQYQMGLFLGKYYHDCPVAFNDIGAASYFTTGRKLDLWGLGNFEVTQSIKEDFYTGDFLNWLSRKDSIKIAVVFEKYFPPKVFHDWRKVGSWKISNNVICADDSVSFFALQVSEEALLRKNLKAYESRLPKGVAARYD
jgi:hypothetical protein